MTRSLKICGKLRLEQSGQTIYVEASDDSITITLSSWRHLFALLSSKRTGLGIKKILKFLKMKKTVSQSIKIFVNEKNILTL